MVKMDEYMKKDEPKTERTNIYSSRKDDVVGCKKCGFENPVEATFCSGCGQVLKETYESQEDKKNYYTPEDKERIIDKVHKLKRIKRRRKEVREINDMEYDRLPNAQIFTAIMAAVGIGFLMYLYMFNPSDWVFVIVILIGATMCIPVGMVLGWFLLDPYMRCKALRRFGKKNYGILNMVGKGQKIISRIKNFDQSIIWKKDECWVLSKQYLYQLSKDGNDIVKKHMIDPECIVTLVNTVPVLFVDIDSFEPLRLSTEGREPINPMEIASQMNAWVDNQVEKETQGKKKMDILMIAVILIVIVAIIMNFLTMSKVDELKTQLDTLRGLLQQSTTP